MKILFILCLFLLLLLLTASVLVLCVFLRPYQNLKETVSQLCDNSPDLMQSEEFAHMKLLDKASYLLHTEAGYQKEEYESTILNRQAELFALQAQINPHFLYNTLDSIRGQAVIEGNDEIAEAIEALSNLFKYSISKGDNLIPLKNEYENLVYYMKIQKYRYLDKIDLIVDVDDESENIWSVNIPKLSLQPIIENAIYHGLEPKVGKGTVRLHFYTIPDKLVIEVIDDGVGMDETALMNIKKSLNAETLETGIPSNSHGIAVFNVNRRIKQYFGADYGLDIFSTKGVGTRVVLYFPIRQ